MKYTINLSAVIAIKTCPAEMSLALARFMAEFGYLGTICALSAKAVPCESQEDSCLVECEFDNGNNCTCDGECPYFLGTKTDEGISTAIIYLDGEFEFESEANDKSEVAAEFFDDMEYIGIPRQLDYNIIRKENNK